MRLGRLTRLALGEAGASPWRYWPLALGIALGVACLVYCLGLAAGVEGLLQRRIVGSLPNRLKVQPSHLQMGPVELSNSITQDKVEALKGLEGVLAVYRQARLPQPCQLYASYGGRGLVTDVIVEGVDAGLVQDDVARGHSFKPSEAGPVPAMLPLAILDILNAGISIHTPLPTLSSQAAVGQTFTLMIGTSSFSPSATFTRRECEIVGVSDQIGMGGPALPLETLEKWQGKALNCYSVTLELDSPQRVDEVARAVEGLGLTTPGLEAARRIATGVSWARVALSGFAAAIMLVAGVGISTGLSLQVREEARTIGLYRAVGATRADIRWIYLARAGSLGLLGAITGVLLGILTGWGTQSLLHQVGGALLGEDGLFVPGWAIPTAGLLFGFLGSVLAGVLPARQAARLRPMEALRGD